MNILVLTNVLFNLSVWYYKWCQSCQQTNWLLDCLSCWRRGVEQTTPDTAVILQCASLRSTRQCRALINIFSLSIPCIRVEDLQLRLEPKCPWEFENYFSAQVGDIASCVWPDPHIQYCLKIANYVHEYSYPAYNFSGFLKFDDCMHLLTDWARRVRTQPPH